MEGGGLVSNVRWAYHARMTKSDSARSKAQLDHERWLLDLTSLPTAAGREDRVIAWIEDWVDRRGRNLKLKRDKVGNLLITQTRTRTDRKRPKPIYITAHLDHPAFVVRKMIDETTVELEFRGGVHDAYFEHARIEILDRADEPHPGVIESLDSKAKPFKRVTARLTRPAALQKGDIGRWWFEDHQNLPHVDQDNFLYTHACDDLAAVAAALATLDLARKRKGLEHVGILFTLAEEVGFVGAIGACKHKSVPKSSRLICLENSRSFAESPIGAGPILRVGDWVSVFEPNLTNAISAILLEHQKKHADYRWQRKLMPGGACEATAFSSYGYESTCVCLPLGNYHNMQDIDGVLNGQRPARVGPEFISVNDYHGMIDLLVRTVRELDGRKIKPIRERMEEIYRKNGHVLKKASS